MWFLGVVAVVFLIALGSSAAKGAEVKHGARILNNCIMVVEDATVWQSDVMIAAGKMIAEKRTIPVIPGLSSTARLMVTLMRDLFPECTWPPEAGWSITGTDGVKLTWSEWIDRVEMINRALAEAEQPGLETVSAPNPTVIATAIASSVGNTVAVGGEADERKAERGCGCGVR